MTSKKAVVAGGSGAIGRALLVALKAEGWETVVISRRSKSVDNADRVIVWDGRKLGEWAKELEGADAVFNLSGPSLFSIWRGANRALLKDGRVQPTEAIARACNACGDAAPKVWINASAIGFYGDKGAQKVTESSQCGSGFMAESCRDWEEAVRVVPTPGVRKVILRVGLVLDKRSGVYPKLLRQTQMFAGAALGSGRQFMSWIHIDDLVKMMLWSIQAPVSGPLNAVSPNPVTNNEMMSFFREACARPRVPNVPTPIINLVSGIAGWDKNFMLGSVKGYPANAVANGFEFDNPDAREVIAEFVGVPKAWA
jgi:uncharacterized protein (TIGR01777 family)